MYVGDNGISTSICNSDTVCQIGVIKQFQLITVAHGCML